MIKVRLNIKKHSAEELKWLAGTLLLYDREVELYVPSNVGLLIQNKQQQLTIENYG